MLIRIYKHLLRPKLQLTAASLAARRHGMTTFAVVGANMAPTLEPGEVAWIEPSHAPQRAQIVAFTSAEFGTAIFPSRIISLPNERVELREVDLYVNESRLPEPYLQVGRAEQEYSLNSKPAQVPDGHVWLMGDFRDMSKDSRHFGPVPIQSIIGRVALAHALGHHGKPRAPR